VTGSLARSLDEQAARALGYRNLNGRGGDVSPIASWAPALAARS
jgi:hypothetical protein